MDVLDMQYVQIDLINAQVSTTARVECYRLSTFVYPLLSVQITDGDGDSDDIRSIQWPINKVNATHWSIVGAQPFLAYYGRNATLTSRLIGHDSSFKEPLKSPQVVLSGAAVVTLPLSQPYRVVDLSGDCFNVTVAVGELRFVDFLPPTTTADPYIDYNLIKYDAARSANGRMTYLRQFVNNFIASAYTTIPLWLVVCGSILVVALTVGFMLLLVIHLRQKHRDMANVHKLTIQHQTTGTASRHTLKSANTSNTSSGSGGGYAMPSTLTVTANHRHNSGWLYSVSITNSPPGTTPPSSMGARSNSLESHYDIPWDQKFRPLPDWLRTELQQSIVDGHPQSVAVRAVPPPQMPKSTYANNNQVTVNFDDHNMMLQ